MAPLSVEGGDILQLISVLPKARLLLSLSLSLVGPVERPSAIPRGVSEAQKENEAHTIYHNLGMCM